MNKVSIIMATYQGETYLKEQIDSLFKLDYKNWNLYICDDGSNDATIEIAMQYKKKNPEKIFIRQNKKKLGITKNFLEGLLWAKSENSPADYYMFCDQDDVWMPEKITIMLTRMKQMEQRYGIQTPFLLFSDALIADANLKVKQTSYHRSQNLDVRKLDLNYLLMENKCSGCMSMLNFELAKKIKVIPERARFHDWWIILLAASFGKISYINCPTILYRQHERNVVGNQKNIEYLKDRLKNIKAQKRILTATQQQAAEFLKIYSKTLPPKKRKIIAQFANLSHQSFLNRRFIIFHNHYLKSTVIRNLGILVLI